MTAPKVLDLDSELGLDAEVPYTVRRVKLLGVEVGIVCDLNSFGLMAVTGEDVDNSDVMNFLESMIVPADWPAFAKLAVNHPAFRGEGGAEKLMGMIRRIMEVAATPFPTKQPSDLQRTASTRSSVRKSAASTASARAKASTRSR